MEISLVKSAAKFFGFSNEVLKSKIFQNLLQTHSNFENFERGLVEREKLQRKREGAIASTLD